MTTRGDRWLRATEWGVGLAATALALAYQFEFARGAGALWRDEVNGVNTALASSWAEVWRLEEFSSYPSLYTLFLRLWASAFGTSDAAWRAAGLFAAVTLLAALWFAARRLGRTPPTVTVALLAVNPELLRWGTTVSAWSLGAACVVVAFVLLREAVARPSPWRLILATCAAVLSVQGAYQNTALVAAMLIAAALVSLPPGPLRGRRWLVIAVVGGVAASTLLPYASLIAHRHSWDVLNQAPVTVRWLTGIALDVPRASGRAGYAAWIACGVAAIVAAARVWFHASTSNDEMDDRRRWVVSLLAVAALSAVLTLTFLDVFKYAPAPYYFFGFVVLSLVCAEGLIRAGGSLFRSAGVAIAAFALMVGALAPRDVIRLPLTDVDAAGTEVTARATAGDLVIVTPWYLAVSFTRYYRGPARVISVPPLADLRVHHYDAIKAQMMAVDPLRPLFDDITSAVRAGHRVWIVSEQESLAPNPQVPTRLGPPPLAGTGWSEWPYEAAWTEQTLEFLARTTTSQRRSALAGVTGLVEHVTLAEAWGAR